MANKHMNRCSTSLVIRENRTSLRYLTITRMATILEKGKYQVCEDAEDLACSYTDGVNVKWYNHFGKYFGSFLYSLVSFDICMCLRTAHRSQVDEYIRHQESVLLPFCNVFLLPFPAPGNC